MVPAKALTLTSIWLKYTPACVLVGVAARMSLYLKPWTSNEYLDLLVKKFLLYLHDRGKCGQCCSQQIKHSNGSELASLNQIHLVLWGQKFLCWDAFLMKVGGLSEPPWHSPGGRSSWYTSPLRGRGEGDQGEQLVFGFSWFWLFPLSCDPAHVTVLTAWATLPGLFPFVLWQ